MSFPVGKECRKSRVPGSSIKPPGPIANALGISYILTGVLNIPLD